MVKRSKSIARTIKDAEQYLSKFSNSIKKPRRYEQLKKVNTIQTKQQQNFEIQNNISVVRFSKLKIRDLGKKQTTLKQFFHKKNTTEVKSKTKDQEQPHVILPTIINEDQKEQQEIDISQILLDNQNTNNQQYDKNKEQKQNLINKNNPQDWWKSIFHQGIQLQQPSKKLQQQETRTIIQAKKIDQKVVKKQIVNVKGIQDKELHNEQYKKQEKQQFPKLKEFFKSEKVKIKQSNKQGDSNKNKMNCNKLNKVESNQIDSKQNKNISNYIIQNKEYAKPQILQQDNEQKDYAKLQNNALIQQQQLSTIGSQIPECEFGMVDCVFVVDTTGSMDPYLERTTEAVEMIVNKIKQQSLEEKVSVKFGLVCYRDHPPQELTYLTEVHDLCSRSEIISIIKQSDCYGGGDGAEAALDGLNEAVKKISWRDSSQLPSLRYIFHICDQPPHGKEFGGYSELWEGGCPCGLTPEKVVTRINRNEIHYRLIMANGLMLQKFAQYLRGKIYNYDETTLDVAIGMEIRISDMVIRELCPYTQQE